MILCVVLCVSLMMSESMVTCRSGKRSEGVQEGWKTGNDD